MRLEGAQIKGIQGMKLEVLSGALSKYFLLLQGDSSSLQFEPSMQV